MRSFLLLLPLLFACTELPHTGGPTDEYEDAAEGGCDETATPVAADEVTALGFAADEVLPILEGSRDAVFVWARDQSATGLVATLTPTGTYQYIDSEPRESGSGSGAEPALDEGCADRLEMEAVLTFVTDDGSFDESLDIVVSAVDTASVDAWVQLDPASLDGTYDLDEDIEHLDPNLDEVDDKTLWIDLAWDAEVVEAVVSGQVTGEDDCPDDGGDCVAWAMNLDVGQTATE